MKLVRRIPSTDSHIWSLADQALVSGCNFLTGILLARFLGLEAFGAYVIAQIYLLYANTFQASLVVSPMMAAVPAEHDRQKQKAMVSGFLGYAVLVMLATVAGVQALAWALGHLSSKIAIDGLAAPLALAMAGFQLQDWMRRALYVDLNNRLVLTGDAIAYGGLLALLMAWGVFGELTAHGALWMMAGSFSASAFFIMTATRLRPCPKMTRHLIGIHANASRNYFFTWQLQWLGSQGIILMGSALVGQHAAGAIRAAQNLLGPVNVLFQWLDNVLPVRTTLRLRDHGKGALITYLERLTWLGLPALGIFVLLLALFDQALMASIYGEEYRPFAFLIVLMGFYYLLGYAYRMPSYYHRATGNTRVLVQASLWWVASAFTIALVSIHWLEEQGILLAMVVGQLVAFISLLFPRRSTASGNGAAGNADRHRHLLLRRSDGSPHLLLPSGNDRVLHQALRMHYPSRWQGRLYRLFRARSLPWRKRLGLTETIDSLADWCPDLSPILAAVPNAEIRYTGGLIGIPGPASKLTLKFMDRNGESLAYARIARQPLAVIRLRNELSVLSALAKLPISRHIPSILTSGTHSATDDFYLVESPGPDLESPRHLTKNHFDILLGLLKERKQSWQEVLAHIEDQTAPLRVESATSALVEGALRALRTAPAESPLSCFEHGDFTPWNIRKNKEGKLFVLDWEHSLEQGLPWMDALHFAYQFHDLVLRVSARKLLPAMRSVFDHPDAPVYAEKTGSPLHSSEPLMILYLLRSLVTGHADGHSSGSGQQAKRLECLALLLGEGPS